MNSLSFFICYTLYWGDIVLSRHLIARLFDDLTDPIENWIENRAVGVHNLKIVCDFEESDGV